jgi:hypothetical protein
MSILDDNSKDIPEGVFLRLSNKLMEFTFEDRVVDDSDSDDDSPYAEYERVARAEIAAIYAINPVRFEELRQIHTTGEGREARRQK